jgi:hypothetical protein
LPRRAGGDANRLYSAKIQSEASKVLDRVVAMFTPPWLEMIFVVQPAQGGPRDHAMTVGQVVAV